MKPVHVEWVDSVSDGSWINREEAINRSGTSDVLATSSVGFLLDEREDYILLATSYMRDGDLVQGTLQIPRVAVKAITDMVEVDRREVETLREALLEAAREAAGGNERTYERLTEVLRETA